MSAVSDPQTPWHGFMPFTKANVLKPLGMKDTGLIPFGTGDLWPTPYNNCVSTAPKECVKTVPRKPNAGYSAGGFVSTMSDLEKFAIGLHNRSVLSWASYNERWKQTKLTSGKNSGQPVNFGLGWVVNVDAKGNTVRVGKGGGGWGWGSQLTLFPNSGYSVILLHNSSGANVLGQAAIDIEFAASHPGVKPAIEVNNVTNECGGTLYVNGRGFLPGEKVSLTVKNAPGLKSPQRLESYFGTPNNSGNFTVQIPYSANPYSGLPGCASGSTATVVVTITASAEFSGEASAEIYLKNCAITWGACPA